MDALDILKGARFTLSLPGAWHRGYFASDAYGNHVALNHPDALRFCLIGAIDREAMVAGEPIEVTAGAKALLADWLTRRYAERYAPEKFPGLALWNDFQSNVRPVLSLLDEVIAHLEFTNAGKV
jgi:hypothetical protein